MLRRIRLEPRPESGLVRVFSALIARLADRRVALNVCYPVCLGVPIDLWTVCGDAYHIEFKRE